MNISTISEDTTIPKYNVWIRKEDVPKWLAIADRPTWIHKQLQEKV